MGAIFSKQVISKKSKNQEHNEQLINKERLRAYIDEISHKLNDKSPTEVHVHGFCNELRKKIIEKYGEPTTKEESVREDKQKEQKVKEVVIDSITRNVNETQIQFHVHSLNEIQSYSYGCPSTATISMLNSYTKQNENNQQMVILVLKNKNKEQIKIDHNVLIQNSEQKSFESPILVHDCSLQSVQSILICLYTQQLFLSVNTFNEILRLSYDLKLTVILQYMTKLYDACDPICTLAKLRETIHNYNADNSKEFIHIIYEVNKNLSAILKHAAIVDLTFEEMKQIVKQRPEIRSYLSLEERNELLVLNAIIDWILRDINSRYDTNVKLLPFVQFNKMTLEQWKQAFNPQLLISYPQKLQDLMFEVQDYYVTNDTSGKFSVFDVYLPLANVEKKFDEKVEKFEMMSTVENKYDNEVNETKRTETETEKSIDDENIKERNKQKEELELLALRSFKNLGTQILNDLPDSSKHSLSFDNHSIILLLGGYQSQVAYKTEQGLFMHQFKPFECCTKKYKDTPVKICDYVWSPLSQRLPKTLAHFRSLKFGSIIFVIGGIDVSKLLHDKTLHPTNECYAYSLTNDDWYKVTPMHFSRGYHGAVLVGSKIFVFGGISLKSKELKLTNTIEVFDITKNVWREIITEGEKPCPRTSFAMAYYQDAVWIIGGLAQLSAEYDYDSGDYLSDVWIFNIQQEQWITSAKLCRLPRPRAFMTTAIFRNKIFLIGGHEVEEKQVNDDSKQITLQDARTNSVVIFRDVNSGWEEGPPLNLARIYPTTTVVEDVLFVIGGSTCKHKHMTEPILGAFSGSYEVYNPDINPKWVEHSMVFAVNGANAITLKSSIDKPIVCANK